MFCRPTFLENVSTHPVGYRVDSILFHLGNGPDVGHYQTGLKRDMQWYVTNDGVTPSKVSNDFLASSVAANSYLYMCSKVC